MARVTKPRKKKVSKVVESVRAALKHCTYEPEVRFWLDTGNVGLNAILGHSGKGIPSGCIIELSGEPSSGKSALAMDVLAAAQSQGYYGLWYDFERSFDLPEADGVEVWAMKRGVQVGSDKLIVLKPYTGIFATEKISEKTPRLITAQELIEEGEMMMTVIKRQEPEARFVVVVDSVVSMLPEEEAVAGLVDVNMRTTTSLSRMMSGLLRRWIGLMPQLGAIAIFVNQLREKPGVMFGDPSYTPGGRSLPFYAHVRARMRRSAGGRMTHSGNVIGIKGILTNHKNKAGGTERRKIGYKIFFDGASKFVPVEQIKGE